MKYQTELSGIPDTTQRVVGTDLSAAIPAAYITSGVHHAIGAMISCETQNLRYAFATHPTQGADGLGHILYVGQTLTLNNGRLLDEIRFINHTNGSVGYYQITPFYEIGV
jgi:hypothetical protein